VDTVPNYVRDSSLHSCRPIAYESPFEARAGGPAYAPIETPTGIALALNELLVSPTGAAGIAIAKQAVPGKADLARRRGDLAIVDCSGPYRSLGSIL
jgi:hypothetical protein